MRIECQEFVVLVGFAGQEGLGHIDQQLDLALFFQVRALLFSPHQPMHHCYSPESSMFEALMLVLLTPQYCMGHMV